MAKMKKENKNNNKVIWVGKNREKENYSQYR